MTQRPGSTTTQPSDVAAVGATVAAPQAGDRPASGRWLPPILLVLLTCSVFWPVCTFKFVDWDDYQNVAQNPLFEPLTTEGLLQIWYVPYLDLYVPVTYTAWAAVSTAARLHAPDADGIWFDPHPFHVLNLLVHVVAAWVVYQVLLALCRSRWPACMGAMVFAIHPVQVEPVAWVTGLKDVLSGLFAMLALWQYIVFAQPGPPGQSKSRVRYLHYSLATAAFVLAILSKPSTVTIPIAAAAIDRLILRRTWGQVFTDLAPWCLLAAGGAWVAHRSQMSPMFDPGPWNRPMLAAHALGTYLCRVAVPLRLAVTYQSAREILADPRHGATAALAVAGMAAVWIVRRRAPWIGAAAIVFAAGVLPVLGLVPFAFERLSLTADRYLYLCMLGPAVALAFALTLGRSSRALALASVAWLFLLGVRAGVRLPAWRDTTTLFQHELAAHSDSALAYEKLATEASREGRADDAINLAARSVCLQPDQSAAYVVLGTILRSRGQTASARVMLGQAGRPPSFPDPVAMAEVARLLVERQDFVRAAGLCRNALALDPEIASAHDCLASALAHQHQYGEALGEARTAVRLDPSWAQAHLTLATLLRDTGQPEAAAHELKEAQRLSSLPHQPGG